MKPPPMTPGAPLRWRVILRETVFYLYAPTKKAAIAKADARLPGWRYLGPVDGSDVATSAEGSTVPP